MAHAETLRPGSGGPILAIFEKEDERKAGGSDGAGRGDGTRRSSPDIDSLVDQFGEERHAGKEAIGRTRGEDEAGTLRTGA